MIKDIKIYESGSGGEFDLLNEDLETIEGLTNQPYLALFGGNIEQSTSNSILQGELRGDWFGNLLLDDENRFNSSFERALNNTALTSSGIRALKIIAENDLKYLKDYADITVNVYLEDISRVVVEVTMKKPDNQSLKVKLVWSFDQNKIVEYKTL